MYKSVQCTGAWGSFLISISVAKRSNELLCLSQKQQHKREWEEKYDDERAKVRMHEKEKFNLRHNCNAILQMQMTFRHP